MSITRPTARRAHSGFTLVELIVSLGLFAVVMTLASGAYLMIIAVNRQAQGLTTGVNNLSFALETMTRDIRTGSNFSTAPGTFTFTDEAGNTVTYGCSSACSVDTPGSLQKTVGSVTSTITDASVQITALTFTLTGASRYSQNGDTTQPRVTIDVRGVVSTGPGKSRTFNVETDATMRGTDL